MSKTPELNFCANCGVALPEIIPEDLCPRCTFGAALDKGETSSDEVDPHTPKVSGFEIHEKVGEGGFGIVYRATQTEMVQRQVALKIIKPGTDTRQVLRRFEVERQALALLEHSNIARIYQVGETENGYPYFTMEYIDGMPITEFLRNHSIKHTIEILLQVCGAISHAHSKGIIHRDLKPSNILITRKGIPKIIDFGIAKATDPLSAPGMTNYTGGEVRLGTPAYMAPEQASSSSLEVDSRVDVYAVGVIFFEILSGVTPLELSTEKAPKDSSKPAWIPRPSEFAIRNVPGELDQVALHALAPDPDRRYGSIDELAVDLRHFLAGEKLSSRASCTPVFFGSFLRPRRVLILLTLAFFGALAAVLLWLKDPLESVKEIEIPASVRFNISGNPHEIILRPDGNRVLGIFRGYGGGLLLNPMTGERIVPLEGRENSIQGSAFTEDGNRFILLYQDGTTRWFSSDDGQTLSSALDVTPKGGAGDSIAHVLVPGASEPIILTTAGDATLRAWSEEGKALWKIRLGPQLFRLKISPDRSFAVAGSRQGEIHLIDLVKKKRVSELKGLQLRTMKINFAADSSRFACASAGGQTAIWNRDGSLQRMIDHEASCEDVVFSPDGLSVATAYHDGTARIWDLESGEERQRFLHQDRVFAVAFSPDGTLLASGGRDRAVRLWLVESGKHWQEPYLVDAAVGELNFVPRMDGSLNLVTITWESAMRIFRLPAKK